MFMSSEKKEDICSRSDCIWKPTSQDPDLYFCLRCDKIKKAEKKKKEQDKKPEPTFSPKIMFMALAVALVITLIMGSARSPRHPRFDRYDHPCSYGC